MSQATTLPTPAHSVNGSTSQQDVAMIDETPNKRKRALDDDGDRDSKKIHLGDQRLDIDDLHIDVGEKYLLCQIPHPASLPRTSEDLYEMFDLASLAAEVAREKPNGEKNALRKTFKGHMKRLGVAGQFEPHKKAEAAPSEFLAMVHMPELEWNVHHVTGREIEDGLSSASLANLGRAMTMSKGPVPKEVWDTSVLGDLAPSGEGHKASAKPNTPGTPLTSMPTNTSRPKPHLAAGQDPARPKRSIKKRAYGDSSFEGYGEGFPDDDLGYSTGEGDAGQKRRKKNSGTASPYPNPMRQQSYGPGMVGA